MTGPQWVAIIGLMVAYGMAMLVMGAILTAGNPWWAMAFIAAFGATGVVIVRIARVRWSERQQPPAGQEGRG